ncbi:hypothetical protein [Streptomyces sp. YIM 121038]|uniref:hypothetical protein n=1 Tax=Streptomyces sp. YIM 121038 TaxID=2136401 RepID=UPI00111021F6|nr:hypothetical protein [Streptomyces sp. YIM 121038]
MQPGPHLPETDEPEALEFLRLTQSLPFSTPYTGEIVDWVTRTSSAQPQPEDAGLSPPGRAVAALRRYGSSDGLAAGEVAARMRDVAHAIALVRNDHYSAEAAHSAPRDARQIASRHEVRRLCVTAGTARSLAGPGRAVVIVQPSDEHDVYWPLGDVIRTGPRLGAEERLGREVLAILAPHVRLADRLSCEGSGVLVQTRPEAVEVAWWSPEPAAESGADIPDPWAFGGVRSLCSTLLRSEGMTISQRTGALLVSR